MQVDYVIPFVDSGNFFYGKTLLGKMLEAILPGKCEFET